MNEAYWIWGKQATQPRILHTMVRVADLDRSLGFYCGTLGMNLLSRVDVEAGRFSIVFISFADDFNGGAIELTHNWDHPDGGYSHGTGYGHVAIGVADVVATCARLEAAGVQITTPPKRLLAGAPMLAFCKDPDGYPIELIQTAGFVADDPAGPARA